MYALIFTCDHMWKFLLLWESFWIFFICENFFLLWESFGISIICVNLIFLSLYENKLAYECHHLKQIFHHQNTIRIIVDFICSKFIFFTLNSSHFFSGYFFSLNKVSLNSLNSVAIFTPFAVLDSLPSMVFYGIHLWL